MGRPQIPSHPKIDIEAWRDAQLSIRRDCRKRKNNEPVFKLVKNWRAKYSSPWSICVGDARMQMDFGIDVALDELYYSMEQSNNVLFANSGDQITFSYKIAIVSCFLQSLADIFDAGKSCCRTSAIVHALLDYLEEESFNILLEAVEENDLHIKYVSTAHMDVMSYIIDEWHEYIQEAELAATRLKSLDDLPPPAEAQKYCEEWFEAFANRQGKQYDSYKHRQRFPFLLEKENDQEWDCVVRDVKLKTYLEEKQEFAYYFYYMCYQYEPDDVFKRHVNRTIEMFSKWPYFDYSDVCPVGDEVNKIAVDTWQKYAGFLVSTWLSTTKMFAGDLGFKTNQHHAQMEYCKGELPYGPWDFISQSV